MRRRTRTRTRIGTGTGAAVALVLAALVSGCTIEPADGKRPSAGEGGDVLAVKIDNVAPARPQTGLDSADVVYVEQVEAGLSRLMAVYASHLPPVVGPVRSARETDLELLRQYDRPALAFSGAQSKLLPLIDGAPVRALPPGKAPGGAYYRGGGKPAPHNLFVRPDALKVDPREGALADAGFRFGPRPKGGTPQTRRTVRFPAARFTFDWVEYEGRWRVAMDGTRARTSGGKELAPSTVVVQYVKVRSSRFHDRAGSVSPFTETVGEGSASVLRDGRAYKARWQRPTASDGTEFTTDDGRRLPFAKGQVWVVYAKA
ncbi:DUF3048 domain-containing protein [Streptomyces venezuelae]|uniref:DUF3048 domain-containing protein n=1 Tax=Streptomyces venezuelae TaxID=54571 RepID=A0A5P2BQY7_STRVZ|nr:DUF3048 domain-containing protein [Streptomyces venezuelae]QES32895.1 DUF3048 domain-containing protein [Streptomyces venezuelae]